MITFALLLNPSTQPKAIVFFARNQLSRSERCALNILATFFIGLILDRMVLVHQASRNFPPKPEN